MPRYLKLMLALEAVLFGALLSFGARPNANAQFLFMLAPLALFILSIVTVVRLFTTRDLRLRRASAAALLLLPLVWLSAGWLGARLRTYNFYRDLPRMQEVVRSVENGTLAIEGQRLRLPAQYKALAYSVHAHKEAGGALTVTFFVGAGFPVKHFAYLYRSDDKLTPEITRDWRSGRKREPCWYEVSD